MLIVHVQIRLKPECVKSFIDATIENARASLQEPGIARFDFVQNTEDSTRFVLVEAYRDDAAPARHKETAHYARWRDSVAPMMAEPRVSVRFREIHPPAADWK